MRGFVQLVACVAAALLVLPGTTNATLGDPLGKHYVVYGATAADVGLDLIDDYVGFVTAELTDSEVAQQRAAGKVAVEIDRKMGRGSYIRDHKLGTNVPTEWRAPSNTEYFIVQYRGPAKADWLTTLRSQATAVYDYLPHHAYLVKLTPTAKATLTSVVHVRHIEPYHPGFKLAPSLTGLTGTHWFVATAYPDTTRSEIVAEVVSAGGVVDVAKTYAVEHVIRFEADAAQARALAHVEGISWIEPTTRDIEMYSNTSSAKLQSGDPTVFSLNSRGIDGSSQVVGVCDNGIDTDTVVDETGKKWLVAVHAAFADHRSESDARMEFAPWGKPAYSHRKIVTYYPPLSPDEWADPPPVLTGDGDGDSGNHGSITAGIIAGDNAVWWERGGSDGVAFAAKLALCDFNIEPVNKAYIGNYYSLDSAAYWEEGYIKGARTFSNSFGTFSATPIDGVPAYSIVSREIDEYLWTKRELLVTDAVGNFGESGYNHSNPELPDPVAPNPGQINPNSRAKNVLAVGGLDVGQESVWGPSNWDLCGTPTIKPNLMARAAMSGPSNSPANGSAGQAGTSFASPAIAGAAALVRDYFHKGFQVNGVETPAHKKTGLSAALVRSIIISSAREIPADRDCAQWPNTVQGWGQPLLDDVLYFADEGPTAAGIIVKDEGDSSPIAGAGDSRTFTVSVQSGKPLRVQLAWTDRGAIPSELTTLVNDLDLTVEGPDHTIYSGNNFNGTKTQPGRAEPDRHNPDEGIRLADPAEGTYTITVTGALIPKGPQPFALAVAGRVAWT